MRIIKKFRIFSHTVSLFKISVFFFSYFFYSDVILPVPAGIKRPTITFSLRPAKLSIFPSCSICKNFCCFLNDAAEINDEVCKLALVIPNRTGSAITVLYLQKPVFYLILINLFFVFALQRLKMSLRFFDKNFLQHLSCNCLNMFIVYKTP